MSDIIEHFVFNEGHAREIRAESQAQRSFKTFDPETRLRKIRRSSFNQHEKKSKYPEKYIPFDSSHNEIYYTIQALLLTLSILALSYHSIRYGRMEYSLLENGQIVNGLVPPRKAVVILTVGYPVQYAILCTLTACMLLYSLISMKPHWSLPLIVLSMADLVCNIGDAIVAFWLLFTKLNFYTAVTYTTGVASIILGQLWVWLGVLRLYELRAFN